MAETGTQFIRNEFFTDIINYYKGVHKVEGATQCQNGRTKNDEIHHLDSLSLNMTDKLLLLTFLFKYHIVTSIITVRTIKHYHY